MSFAYDKIFHNNAMESGDILISGESVGNFKNLVIVNGTPEIKETKDVSSQLGKRIEAWRVNENFEASCVLQDWDFDKLDRFGLFNIVTAATKVRDEIVSRLPSHPVILRCGKAIDATANAVTGETITQTGSGATRTFQLANDRVVFGSLGFGDGVETWTDDEFGILTGSAGGSGKVNYETGYGQIVWNSSSPGAVTNGAYSYYTDYQFNFKFYKAKIVRNGDLSYDTDGGGGFYLPIRILGCVTTAGYSVEIEKVVTT